MATRYSGSLCIRLTVNDWGEYSGLASGPEGLRFPIRGLRLSPELWRRLASDSPEAYDHAALAALGFWSAEEELVYAHALTVDRPSAPMFGVSRRKGARVVLWKE